MSFFEFFDLLNCLVVTAVEKEFAELLLSFLVRGIVWIKLLLALLAILLPCSFIILYCLTKIALSLFVGDTNFRICNC